MPFYDLVIRGGTVVTAERTLRTDVGVRAGKIVELKEGLAGKRTIAEFVENEEIYNKLKEIGVDYAQGYGLHRPEAWTR